MDQVQERKESSNAGRQTPTRDAAREHKGIFDVLPEDEDYEDIVRTRTGNWKHQRLPRCRVTTSQPALRVQDAGEDPTRLNSKNCVLESLESEGQTLVNSQQDHIVLRRYHSMCHYGLVRTQMPTPKAMKIPATQAAVEGDTLIDLPSWSESKVRAKADVRREAQNKQTSVHAATIWSRAT